MDIVWNQRVNKYLDNIFFQTIPFTLDVIHNDQYLFLFAIQPFKTGNQFAAGKDNNAGKYVQTVLYHLRAAQGWDAKIQ